MRPFYISMWHFLLAALLCACQHTGGVNPIRETPAITDQPALRSTPSVAIPTQIQTTKIMAYFIALEDNGKSGKLIGCNDSVVGIEAEISPATDLMRAALEILFSFQGQQFIEPDKFYNALHQSELKVTSIAVNGQGEATIHLTGTYLLGGVCDNPRFKAQIEETVSQFPEVKSTKIFINDLALDDILSNK